jgi:cobalt transport protein
MSKHHRNRNWAPAPQPLPEDAHVIDNHTHVASVVPFSQAMSHEAMEKGQGEVPVYSVDELLKQAQDVGVEGVIDCGCELPNLMTAIDMAREHPGTVHAAIAIHPNEAVLHGHRGAPGPDGQPGQAFGGADEQAQQAIGQLAPGYQPWFAPLIEPASSEIASLLFALQAAFGAGVIGYWLGCAKRKAAIFTGGLQKAVQNDKKYAFPVAKICKSCFFEQDAQVWCAIILHIDRLHQRCAKVGLHYAKNCSMLKTQKGSWV